MEGHSFLYNMPTVLFQTHVEMPFEILVMTKQGFKASLVWLVITFAKYKKVKAVDATDDIPQW